MASSITKIFTKQHAVGAGVAAIAACIPLVTGVFALDARYEKAVDADAQYELLLAQAAEKHYHQDVEREEGDLKTKLSLINNRLKYLAAKSMRTSDEEEEISYLREERRIIMRRLQELTQA